MLQAAQSQRTLELPMMRTIKIKRTQKMPKTTNRQLRLIVMRKIIQKTVQKAEQTLRLFQVQKIIPLHRLLIIIYHHLILQINLQVLHRYLNLSQRITTAISFLLIKISHYSHISDKHNIFSNRCKWWRQRYWVASWTEVLLNFNTESRRCKEYRWYYMG